MLVDLDRDLSIFVGANNSGKTSTAHAVKFFTNASKDRLSLHDFNADCWCEIDDFGEKRQGTCLPKISIDFWFHVQAADVHRVVDLLPSLDWEGSLVGLRVEFAAEDEDGLVARFEAARESARANVRPGRNGADEYHPPPRTLCEYLSENLKREFGFRYYVLDSSRFDADLMQAANYEPREIVHDKGRGPKETLNALLRVDFLEAQRHLSDSGGTGRAEDLSKRLSRFYDHNLEKRGDDYDAMHALAESEALLNQHLGRVFEPVLERLATLGYPGVDNPRLVIKSALNPVSILSSHDGAKVHYALDDPEDGSEGTTLPDSYNGLGYKNLIYIVVELLDVHTRWMDIEEDRPPVHLVFIEEPEVHLHAQLQQVFIREVLDIMPIEGEDKAFYHSQVVVTTHSSHILYERGFQPIRYFRRQSAGHGMSSEVLNLSAFYKQTEQPTNDFLERYLKLTHCDLFFADAAVLVEGNVERLLMPQMVEKAAPKLKSAYLSILEIGGAFGHRFRSLIEFLGITALIITDIDSVVGGQEDVGDDEADEVDEDSAAHAGKACMVHEEGAETSNQTLIQWLPRKKVIQHLLATKEENRIQRRGPESPALARVTYQVPVSVTWNGETADWTGRTLEEAFALENLQWCQAVEQKELKLRISKCDERSLEDIVGRLHKKIKSSNFKKTDFALALLTQDPKSWTVPTYIAEGLRWLEGEITPIVAVEAIAPEPEGGAHD